MKQLRETIKQQRLDLPQIEHIVYSNAIAQQLFELPIFQNSQKIACYLQHKGEVETNEIIEKIWTDDKECYLPVITADKSMLFIQYTRHTRANPNVYGILEPDVTDGVFLDARELDLVVTPLIAFNLQRYRLGWSLGHYDRAFAFLLNTTRPAKPYLLGLAYNFQLNNNIIVQSWDVPLDLVVTEQGII